MPEENTPTLKTNIQITNFPSFSTLNWYIRSGLLIKFLLHNFGFAVSFPYTYKTLAS